MNDARLTDRFGFRLHPILSAPSKLGPASTGGAGRYVNAHVNHSVSTGIRCTSNVPGRLHRALQQYKGQNVGGAEPLNLIIPPSTNTTLHHAVLLQVYKSQHFDMCRRSSCTLPSRRTGCKVFNMALHTRRAVLWPHACQK